MTQLYLRVTNLAYYKVSYYMTGNSKFNDNLAHKCLNKTFTSFVEDHQHSQYEYW